MKNHPLSEIFPNMEGAEFAALVEDIRAHGQVQPLVMYQGKILDGRNRARACERIGIKPKTVDYRGTDPLGYVLSLNLSRRHLTDSQRAMVGARIANLKLGSNQHVTGEGGSRDPPSVSIAEAAKRSESSPGSVKRAKKVLDHGTKDLAKAVDDRKIDVATAAKLVDAPANTQRAAAEGGKAVAREIVKKIEEKQEDAPEIPPDPPVKTFGRPLPPEVSAKIDLRLHMIDKMSKLLMKLAGQLTAYEHEIAAKGKPEREHRITEFREPLEILAHRIRAQRPVSVCYLCKLVPEAQKTCAACRGFGFLRKEQMANVHPVYLQEGDDAIICINGKEISLLAATVDDF